MEPMLLRTVAPTPWMSKVNKRVFADNLGSHTSEVSVANTFLMTDREIVAAAIDSDFG